MEYLTVAAIVTMAVLTVLLCELLFSLHQKWLEDEETRDRTRLIQIGVVIVICLMLGLAAYLAPKVSTNTWIDYLTLYAIACAAALCALALSGSLGYLAGSTFAPDWVEIFSWLLFACFIIPPMLKLLYELYQKIRQT